MMKIFYCVYLALLLSFTSLSNANELQVEYKTFYSHVKKLKGEDTQALQFAFGFMNIHTNQLCQINEARISTDKQQIPLNVTSENRFTIPSENALRQADALIILDLEEATNVCDISVQLETKPEFLKQQYPTTELEFLYSQYQAFFNEMGGFMSFMMPQVDGLTIQFANKELNKSLSNGMLIRNGMLTVSEQDFRMLDNIMLPEAPLRITAKTYRS